MINEMKYYIKFQNQALSELRRNLLADLSNEYFACLLAKTHVIADLCIITVVKAVYPDLSYYQRQGTAALKVSSDFMREVLIEADKRIDVDTVIDVHTHPFSMASAWFSGVDDRDEENFARYLHEEAPEISYLSIVFSQTTYQARFWDASGNGRPRHYPAFIRTQKLSEAIPSSDDPPEKDNPEISEMFNRSVLALGMDTMRKITGGQEITVTGVGGIGSIIAEQLVHMGFSRINLIDHDNLELSNLNRIEGVTYEDAVSGKVKVDVIRNHLLSVNPEAQVNAYNMNVFDAGFEEIIARSDWIMIATDTAASRYRIQELAFKYYVPFITAGVNITVDDGKITDMSGETILVRIGDKVCLTCLGRLDYNEIAKEIHPDRRVREGLVAKGYVTGLDVKEPAIKTLNTQLANMAVNVLVNQYTERDRDAVITVYEDNGFPAIYEDTESVKFRDLHCRVCDIQG